MAGYIKVAQNESAEPVELPLENDGTLLVSTLTALFPGTSGLKFRSETKSLRGVRLADSKLYPPEGDRVYSVVSHQPPPEGEIIRIQTEMEKVKGMLAIVNNQLISTKKKLDNTTRRLKEYEVRRY